MNPENTIVITLIFFAVLVILFLLFRAILLWYWKIDVQIKLKEENNNLLTNILIEIKKSNLIAKNKVSGSPKKTEIKNKINEESELDKLKRQLKTTEAIVLMKDTNEYVVMPKTQFELIKEKELGIKFTFIYEK